MKFNKFFLKRLWLLLFFPAGAALTWLASVNSGFIENFYSTGVYPVVTAVLGFLPSLAPFSVAELLIIAATLLSLFYIIKTALSIKKSKSGRVFIIYRFLAALLGASAAVYFIFVLTCGLNYYRLPFSYYAGLELAPASAEELFAVTSLIAERTIAERAMVAEDDAGVMVPGASSFETARAALDCFELMTVDYPIFRGVNYSRPKPVFFSRYMSHTRIMGVYFPFTAESNVNVDIPAFSIPSTMCHELSHQRGFMREDEANYIAYLACLKSDLPEFRYSGLMLAFMQCYSALYSADRELAFKVYETLSPGVIADLRNNSQYWNRFEGKVAAVSTTINDTYLKVNRQADGVKSYGRVVDLLIAEHRKQTEAN